MANFSLPLVDHDHSSWGCINYFGKKHVICAEKFDVKNEKYSFKGGHRVRLYTVEGNVHWKIPADTVIDIADVKVAQVPPQRRQNKKGK
jgi:hypothetical protein